MKKYINNNKMKTDDDDGDEAKMNRIYYSYNNSRRKDNKRAGKRVDPKLIAPAVAATALRQSGSEK
jgi:hypothetical protein